MDYRRLGRTELALSHCTFGTLALDHGADPVAVREALALAFDRGVNAIELAAGGRAENILSDLLPALRNGRELHVLSRISAFGPFDIPAPQVSAFDLYPGRLIREHTERLLKALRVERLGCQMIHAWCPEWLGEGDWLEELQQLQQEGKIAAIGVSMFDHDADAALSLVASGAVDCVEVMYNIFDPGAAQALFPACHQHGVGILARSPLYFGALSRRIADPEPFPVDDWRAAFFFPDHLSETRDRAAALLQIAGREGEDLAGLALRFAASHPAISTVATGISAVQQVIQNLDAFERGPISGETLAALWEHRWLC